MYAFKGKIKNYLNRISKVGKFLMGRYDVMLLGISLTKFESIFLCIVSYT